MILVTGATGNNGRELVKQLSEAGVKVRAMVRNPEKAADLAGPGVEVVAGSFDDAASLDSALQGIERAFLLTPLDPAMVERQKNFIEAAQRSGTQHIVKFSALGADVNSAMRLGRWHGETERYLEASGIAFTHLRPNGFMQNLLMFSYAIANQGVFYQPAANAEISHVDIRDIVAVAAKTLTEDGHAGKTYTITGPAAITFDEVAERLSAALGKTVQYVNPTPADFKQSLLSWGQPDWMADTLNEMYDLYRAGWGGEVTDTVKTVAQKEPISIDQFIQDHRQAFM